MLGLRVFKCYFTNDTQDFLHARYDGQCCQLEGMWNRPEKEPWVGFQGFALGVPLVCSLGEG